MAMFQSDEERIESIQRQLDEFDPNAQADHEWAVFKPDTRPHWKVYRSRGNALSCLGWAWPGIIYQKETDGLWREVARVDPSIKWTADQCEKCDKRFEISKYGYYPYDRKFVWIGQPSLRLIACCNECNSYLLKYKIDDRNL
jgi:hypothetical protein